MPHGKQEEIVEGKVFNQKNTFGVKFNQNFRFSPLIKQISLNTRKVSLDKTVINLSHTAKIISPRFHMNMRVFAHPQLQHRKFTQNQTLIKTFPATFVDI